MKSVEHFNRFMLSELEEIFEEEVASRLPFHRERVADWIAGHGIADELWRRVKKSDLVYLQNAGRILEWWARDPIYLDRRLRGDEIKKEWWFWWLDEIVAGTYPFEMIPDYLQDEARQYYGKGNDLHDG